MALKEEELSPIQTSDADRISGEKWRRFGESVAGAPSTLLSLL